MRKLYGFSKLLSFYTILGLSMPALALADDAGTIDPTPATRLVLPTDQLWAMFVAGFVPLVMYGINKYAPWVSDSAKLFAHGIAAAIVGGVVQAITAGGVGLNQVTFQFVVSAVGAAVLAHVIAWSRTELPARLGAGQNKPGQVPGSLQAPPA